MHYFLKLVKFSKVNWNVHKALSTQFILFVVQTSHITYKGIFYMIFWIIILNKNTAMEDAHIHLLSLPNDKDTCFFGVFDGHGGS